MLRQNKIGSISRDNFRRIDSVIRPDRLKQFYEKKQQSYRQKIQSLTKQLSSLKFQNRQLEMQNEQLKQQFDTGIPSRNNIKMEKVYKQEKLKKGDIKRLEIFIEMLIGQSVKNCSTIQQMLDELQSIVYEYESKGTLYKLSLQDLHLAKQKIYQNQIDQLNKQIKNWIKDTDFYSHKNQQITLQNKQLKQQIEDLYQQVNKLKKQVKKKQTVHNQKQQTIITPPVIRTFVVDDNQTLEYHKLQILYQNMLKQQKLQSIQVERKQRQTLKWKARYEDIEKQLKIKTEAFGQDIFKQNLKIIELEAQLKI